MRKIKDCYRKLKCYKDIIKEYNFICSKNTIAIYTNNVNLYYFPKNNEDIIVNYKEQRNYKIEEKNKIASIPTYMRIKKQ